MSQENPLSDTKETFKDEQNPVQTYVETLEKDKAPIIQTKSDMTSEEKAKAHSSQPSNFSILSFSKSSSSKLVNPIDKIKSKVKLLYEKYKQDLSPSETHMHNAIKNVENWVKNEEVQRNFKMKSEFEREKEYKMEENYEIKNQIDKLKQNDASEQLLKNFNQKIVEQKEIYAKFKEQKDEIKAKIQYLKASLPELQKKLKEKTELLKQTNKDNLRLLDQIEKIEYDQLNNSLSFNNSQTFNNSSNIGYGSSNSYSNNNSGMNNSQVWNQSTGVLNTSEKMPNSININSVIEENQELKNHYNRIITLKKLYKIKCFENQKLVKNLNEMTNECFLFKKLFNDGLHEISKELLKIHEMQLEKVIKSGGQNASTNSLYFEMVRANVNNNEKKNDDVLKLPLINNSIKEKYNFPIVEKSSTNTVIYKVIKNMLDERYRQNKISNMKKNKFSWDEFKEFSSFQIYTILNMNKSVIKMIESYLFPRKLLFKEDKESVFDTKTSKIEAE